MPACSHTLRHTYTNHTGTRIYKLQKGQGDQRVEHGTVVCTAPLPTIDKYQVFFYYCRNVAYAKNAIKAASQRYYWHIHWFLFCVNEVAVIFYLCAFSGMCHMIGEAPLASLYNANVFQFPPTKSIHSSYKRWLETAS